MKTNTRGEALTLILVALLVLGGGAFGLSKTKWFHGDSKRAKTSTETTTALVEATDKKAAVAAASVVKIGEANAEAPDSPARDFIAREVPVALASLPAPDVLALIEAEKRKVAVMEGRLQEAAALYGDALKRANQLERDRAQALAAKRASDTALEQVAAERRGAEQQAFWMYLVAGAAVVLYVYTKLTHTSPWAMARAVVDIKQGTSETNQAIASIDHATTPLQQMMIKAHTKLHKIFD